MAEIVVKQWDGTNPPREIARVSTTPEGRVQILGEHRAAAMLEKLKTRDRGPVYTIDDGQPWVDALPATLLGTYLWAEKA